MAQLHLHGQKINTVFDLLGNKENDITFSLGWALAHSDSFQRRLLSNLFPGKETGEVTHIDLQKHGGKHGGYTDIEMTTDRVHLIIEAKRGTALPGKAQLKKYVRRFRRRGSKAIVVMAEREPSFASSNLPKAVSSVPIRYRSWKQVTKIAKRSVASETHAAKRLLREFGTYMEGLMEMQNQKSNEVYVVALGAAFPMERWWHGAWRDFVITERLYFQPVNVRWPRVPPNYLGFRYDGRLQSIHHIDKLEVVDTLEGRIPARRIFGWMRRPHILCKLGPPFKPARAVRSGNIMDRRMTAALDLLLTSMTLTAAYNKTKKRLKE
jgi:hypothetical protein